MLLKKPHRTACSLFFSVFDSALLLLLFIQHAEVCPLKVHCTSLLQEAQADVTRILNLIVQQALFAEDMYMFNLSRGAHPLIFMWAQDMTTPQYLWFSN